MLRILKRLRRWRNSSGFTLVEVIIASALLGLLVLGVFSFVTPVLKVVSNQEQNARALMLSETMNNYIASTLRYAIYVQPITGVTSGETHPTAPPGTITNAMSARSVPFSNTTGETYLDKYDGGTLDKLYNALYGTSGTIVTKPDDYEIGCIGIRWLTDEKTGTKKLFLTKETVYQKESNSNANLYLDESKSKLVFETCFYDGLFPVIDIENYSNQYFVVDEDGNRTEQVAEDKLDLAKSLRIVTKVYTDSDCYSTNETVRDNAMLAFQGTGYAPLEYISSKILNESGSYELRPNIQIHDYTAALNASGVTESEFYPDTYIYYIAKKSA